MTSKKMMQQLDEIIKAAVVSAEREREDGNDRAAEGYAEFYHKLQSARDTLIFKVPSE